MARTKAQDPVSEAALARLAPIARSPNITLSDQVYEEVLRLIIDGMIGPGQSLPTEAELCARLRVSRTVVREALSRLKFDGIIASHSGRKSTVLTEVPAGRLSSAEAGSLTDIRRFFEFRELLEREAAAMAAMRRQPDDLARIRAANLAQAKAFRRGDDDVTDDVALHEAIVMASHNHFLIDALAGVRRNYLSNLGFTRRVLQRDGRARATQEAIDEHTAIIEAIERADAGAARERMSRHLQRSRERFLAAIGHGTPPASLATARTEGAAPATGRRDQLHDASVSGS